MPELIDGAATGGQPGSPLPERSELSELKASDEGANTKPTLSAVKLASLTFFAVCGGPFGLEPLVKNGGARNALLGLLAIPWVYSLPMALMTAELSTALPQSGGYIVWLHRAFGDRWAVQASVWTICNSFLDNAGYPIMFVDYLMEYASSPWENSSGGHIVGNATLAVAKSAADSAGEDWSMGAQWCLGMLMLVPIAGLNLRGASATADGAVGFTVLVLAPVLVMVVLGLPNVNIEALTAPPDERTKAWAGFLTLLLWNNSGYDSAGTVASEVADPGKTYVPAMAMTMAMASAAYCLPTMVGVCAGTKDGGTGTDVTQWFDGYWTTVAAHIGGNWLAVRTVSARNTTFGSQSAAVSLA